MDGGCHLSTLCEQDGTSTAGAGDAGNGWDALRVTAVAPDANEGLELRVWFLSAVVVLLVHAAFVVALVHWDSAAESANEIILPLDLAPEPAAPAARLTDIPPGPQEVQARSQPDKNVKQEEPEREEKIVEQADLKADAEQNPQADVVVSRPTTAEDRKPEPAKPPEKRPPAPATSKPQTAQVRDASRPAAPLTANPVAGDSNAIPNWESLVLGILQRGKRYPPDAEARHEQGVARLAFSVDRQGRVVASRIVGSSGSSALDAETLALVQRSQPFPPPPLEMRGSQISLTAAIRYNIQ